MYKIVAKKLVDFAMGWRDAATYLVPKSATGIPEQTQTEMHAKIIASFKKGVQECVILVL